MHIGTGWQARPAASRAGGRREVGRVRRRRREAALGTAAGGRETRRDAQGDARSPLAWPALTAAVCAGCSVSHAKRLHVRAAAACAEAKGVDAAVSFIRPRHPLSWMRGG
jgi:hypothetical protein